MYVTPDIMFIKSALAIKLIILTAFVLAQTDATSRSMFREFSLGQAIIWTNAGILLIRPLGTS